MQLYCILQAAPHMRGRSQRAATPRPPTYSTRPIPYTQDRPRHHAHTELHTRADPPKYMQALMSSR
eukprot:7125059-Prymnesium_polylepis.2